MSADLAGELRRNHRGRVIGPGLFNRLPPSKTSGFGDLIRGRVNEKSAEAKGFVVEQRPAIIVKHAQVVSVLTEMGLHEEKLQEAVQKAYAEAFGCTDHDPRGLPGYLAYGKIVRHLRDAYVPLGWLPSSDNNFELTTHPAGEFSVVVWAGTREAGTVTGSPTNRNPKGISSRKITATNQASFADFIATFPRFGTEIIAGKPCWVLLHYHDRHSDELRIELSYPLDYSEGHIRNWGPRIILGAIPVGPAPFLEEEGDDIDIDVALRREA